MLDETKEHDGGSEHIDEARERLRNFPILGEETREEKRHKSAPKPLDAEA